MGNGKIITGGYGSHKIKVLHTPNLGLSVMLLSGAEVAATSVPDKTMTLNPQLAVHMHLYEKQRLSKVLFTTLKISISLLFWVGLFIPKIVFCISGQGTSEGKGTNHLSFF